MFYIYVDVSDTTDFVHVQTFSFRQTHLRLVRSNRQSDKLIQVKVIVLSVVVDGFNNNYYYLRR